MRPIARLILIGLLLTLATTTSAFAQTFKRIEKVADIGTQFEPGIQLYVHGTIRSGSSSLSDADLNALAAELTRYPTWTVVLTDDVRNEVFTPSDGRARVGLDGAEFAVGNGLFANSSFAGRRDEATGLKSASALLFYFGTDRRRAWYFSSALQEQYGLRHSEVWEQRYMSYVKAAMSKGRLQDVVLDPLRALDTDLRRNIASNEQARVASQKDAESAVTAAKSSLTSLETMVSQFREHWPHASGSLAQPNLAALRGKVETAESALKANDLVQAKTLSTEVAAAVEAIRLVVAEYPSGQQKLASIKSEIAALPALPFSHTAADRLPKLDANWNRARDLWERGESNCMALIAALDTEVKEVRRSIYEAEKSAAQWEEIKLLFQIMLGAFVLVVIYIARRLRNQAYRNALATHKAQRSAITEKLYGTIDLEVEGRRFLGATRSETEKRFTGATLERALELGSSLDRARILAGPLDRRLRECEAILSPKSIAARCRNQLWYAPYDRVEQLLTDTPIEIDPKSAEGVELYGNTPLWAPAESYETQHSKPWDLFEEINETLRRADEAFAEVRSAMTTVGATLRDGSGRVDRLEELLLRLKGQNIVFPQLQGVGLPELDRAIADLQPRAQRDPLGIIEEATRLGEKIDVVEKILKDVASAGENEIPGLIILESLIKGRSVNPAWIGQRVQALIKQIGEALRAAINGGKSAPFSVREELTDVQNQAKQVLSVCDALDTARRQHATLGASVADVQRRLAVQFGVSESDLLVEEGANVVSGLVDASRLLDTISTPLNEGNADRASEILQVVTSELDRLRSIVSQTEESVRAHQGLITENEQLASEHRAVLPECAAIIKSMTEEVDSDSLQLPRDLLLEGGTVTVADNLEEISVLEANRIKGVSRAQELIRSGKILEGMRVLGRAQANTRQIGFRIKEIRDHRSFLDRLEHETSELIDSAVRSLGTPSMFSDSRLSARTVAEAKATVAEVNAASRKTAEHPRRVVYRHARANELVARVKRLQSAVSSDFAAHAKAHELFDKQTEQINYADRALVRFSQDRVPDSQLIEAVRSRINGLKRRREALTKALNTANSDWDALRSELTEMTSTISLAIADLKKEEALARSAADSITNAKRAVNDANNWSGRYGVSINDGRGNRELQLAATALARGDYESAIRNAGIAVTYANDAVEHAEAAERAERRRRDAEAAARSSRRNDDGYTNNYGGNYTSHTDTSTSGGSWGGFGGGASVSGGTGGDF